MRVGIVGAGKIGGTLARLLGRRGDDVTIANSRGPDSLTDVVKRIDSELDSELDSGTGSGTVRAGTIEEAVTGQELVIIAIPFGRYAELPRERISGIVVDANNYYPERDGRFPELDDGSTTSSEMLAAALPNARVVKAFNTIYWERLRDKGRPSGDPGRLAIPVAGADQTAKAQVATLIDSIGFDPVDDGDLADSWRQQPGTPVYNVPLTRDEVRQRLRAA
jgi:predicted dinucleotide-binding enzyme